MGTFNAMVTLGKAVVGDHSTTRVIYYITCVQWNCDLAAFKMIASKMGTRSATAYTELPNWKWLNKSAVSLDWMFPKIGNYLQSAFINLMSVNCKPSPICLSNQSGLDHDCVETSWLPPGDLCNHLAFASGHQEGASGCIRSHLVSEHEKKST